MSPAGGGEKFGGKFTDKNEAAAILRKHWIIRKLVVHGCFLFVCQPNGETADRKKWTGFLGEKNDGILSMTRGSVYDLQTWIFCPCQKRPFCVRPSKRQMSLFGL